MLYTWKKLKSNKNNVRIKENKEKESIKPENKNCEELSYKSSLYKVSRFKFFCG